MGLMGMIDRRRADFHPRRPLKPELSGHLEMVPATQTIRVKKRSQTNVRGDTFIGVTNTTVKRDSLDPTLEPNLSFGAGLASFKRKHGVRRSMVEAGDGGCTRGRSCSRGDDDQAYESRKGGRRSQSQNEMYMSDSTKNWATKAQTRKSPYKRTDKGRHYV